MKTPNLDWLRRMLEEATPGPWKWWSSNSHFRLGTDEADGNVLSGAISFYDQHPTIDGREEDRLLISESRNMLPEVLDYVEALQGKIDAIEFAQKQDLIRARRVVDILRNLRGQAMVKEDTELATALQEAMEAFVKEPAVA